jgi:mevalonate pyrophosphate decarboxylase
MDLKELKNKVELLRTYDLENPKHLNDFIDNIYTPVSASIAHNDMAVIDYISHCEAEDQANLYTAIVDGVADRVATGQHSDAMDLYRKIRRDNDFRVDERIQRLIAV